MLGELLAIQTWRRYDSCREKVKSGNMIYNTLIYKLISTGFQGDIECTSEVSYKRLWLLALEEGRCPFVKTLKLPYGKTHLWRATEANSQWGIEESYQHLLFFDDPVDVDNLISGSSAFSKTSLNIWKFTVHVLLKPDLENFEHYFTSVPSA